MVTHGYAYIYESPSRAHAWETDCLWGKQGQVGTYRCVNISKLLWPGWPDTPPWILSSISECVYVTQYLDHPGELVLQVCPRLSRHPFPHSGQGFCPCTLISSVRRTRLLAIWTHMYTDTTPTQSPRSHVYSMNVINSQGNAQNVCRNLLVDKSM